MGNVTQLDDIEEFSLVRRVPRAAITDEVLNGVRQLHETEHIEPFLRLILSDTTETPHGSTEIADILTTQVTYGGQPQLAAFVNKGRSTPRVRSGNVAHQVVRLGRLPRIDLMVLLAVGEIQDDIKADLLQVSRDAGAKYMIVDARDVARLFIAYQKVCPKDGTPFNDGQCPTCGTSADEPVELTLKLHEELRYEFLPHNDVSHAGAKRYRANVLTTDPHYAKSALREVVKEATWALRQSDYYRSPITEGYFGQQEADCVFLFVYLDLRDVQQTNWICRTQWIRPDLPQQFKPLEWHGDERLGDILMLGTDPGAELHAKVGDLVHWFKIKVQAAYRKQVAAGVWPPYRKQLWQRNFHDRIIRNDCELDQIRDYIVANPARWTEKRKDT